MNLELETYTPSEAEEITGVTQATVRNWRRAGHLQRHKGHARYTIADLLVIFATGLMVQRGVKAKAASTFAGEAARAIFQNALYREETYSSEAKEAALQSNPEPFFAKDELRQSAAQQFGVAGIKSPDWLVIWADDNLEFLYDADTDGETADGQFFGNIQYSQPYVQGPVMMFCLGALAHMIATRLPRPAIKLSEVEVTG